MDGLESAKEQRNWLERLGSHIPGFKGFQDRELRRDVDRMQREQLSRELSALKASVRKSARDYTDAGQIGVLHLFERVDGKLDGLSQAIRFADYGASGFFDVVKFGEDELARLYEFDLSFLEETKALEGEVVAIPSPGSAEAKSAIDRVVDRLEDMASRWRDRKVLIGDVVSAS